MNSPQDHRAHPAAGPPRRGRHRAAALLTVLGTVLALLLGGAGPASAHAALVSTDPPQDAVVATAPSRVVLTFSEGVTLAADAVQVFDPSGRRVDRGPAAHDGGRTATAAVGLGSGLPQGTYTVSWRAVSDDSHPVSGAFTFSVGKRTQSAVPSEVARRDGGSTAVGVLYGTARAAAFGAFALLVGAAAFVLLCWPRGAATRQVQRLLMAGWGGLLVSTVAVLLLRGPYERGSGLGDALDLSLVRATLDERLGTALAARLLLLAAAGVFLSLLVGQLGQEPAAASGRRPDAGDTGDDEDAGDAGEPDDPEAAELRRLEERAAARPEREARIGLAGAGLLLAAALAATWAAADHASVGLQAGLALPLDVLHLLAMAVWLGGLAALLTGLRIPRERGGAGPAAAEAFSRTAFVCVAVLVATGVYQSWRGLGTWGAFTSTDYGRLLLVKIGLVAVLLGAAWSSRAWTARLRTAAPGAADAAGAGEAAVPAGAAGRRDAAEPAGGEDVPDPVRRAQLDRQRAARAAAAERRTRSESLARERAAGGGRSGLRRSVLAEVAVAAAVLAVTTLLTNSPPGRTAAAAAPAAARPVSLTVPYDTGGDGPGAKGTAAVTLDPGRTGGNAVHVTLSDPAGRPVDVPEVRAALTLPARNLGPLRPVLEKVDAGHWTAQVQLPVAGDWRLTLTVRSSDIDEVEETAQVHVG
ncbi:FixH family protein [Streptacidiphilus sp. ASG 303]|uniref:FixH family protein n=1 Tax=Streptacidiphilus sp. ASG 303 TaxID=2896847 RepID=UPI001E426ECC|nr:FixH family protein [Streptacidiphilus sp. ASG 303]MCD0482302.1 FixH family protein [Streptacidiphilus sp. ASG 303]